MTPALTPESRSQARVEVTPELIAVLPQIELAIGNSSDECKLQFEFLKFQLLRAAVKARVAA